MRKPITLLTTSLVLAISVAACGGSSGSSSSAASATGSPAAAASATLASAAASSDSRAAASKLSISAATSGALMFSTTRLKAKAGTVVITFVNHSPEGHNLTVVHGTNGREVGATPTFSGGSKTLTLHLTAGRYTYYCSVPGHRQGGMQGTLTVS